jgi:hypothetical protein
MELRSSRSSSLKVVGLYLERPLWLARLTEVWLGGFGYSDLKEVAGNRPAMGFECC